MYMLYENKYIWNLQGGLGGYPPEAEENLKKIKQNGGFSFMFCFLAGLPRSPKLWACFPAPLDPWK